MHYYCTTLSKDYIHKGLMLYNSLKKHDKKFKMFIICMHDEVKNLLGKIIYENAVFIAIKDIETWDSELISVKLGRSEKEYAWTSKASIILYLLSNYSELNHIVWLDSDIVFYSDPQPIFNELKLCSILLTKEGFKGINKKLKNVYGVFNTGLMGFKRNEYSIKRIDWLRKKCIEWCYDWILPGKWSDQMYLNHWDKRFKGVRVIKNIGINATAWNVQGCKARKIDNEIYLDDTKLIFYHYSGFRYYNKNEFDLCCYIVIPEDVKTHIYMPYVENYRHTIEFIDSYDKTMYKEKSMEGVTLFNYYNTGGDKSNE